MLKDAIESNDYLGRAATKGEFKDSGGWVKSSVLGLSVEGSKMEVLKVSFRVHCFWLIFMRRIQFRMGGCWIGAEWF